MTSRWPEIATADGMRDPAPRTEDEMRVAVPVRAADDSRYRVPAAARTVALLEYLAREPAPQGVSAVARCLGIPKSSCFALLSTLEEAGYVRRDPHDDWALTLRIYHVGVSAARNVDILVMAEPILNELCDATGLTVHLGIFDGHSIIYALKVDPPGRMVKFDTYPGKTASPHLTAVGRAIAAVLSERDLDALLDGYEFTPGDNSRIRDREGMMAELENVRRLGFSFENEEETLGVGCLAAAFPYAGGAAAVGVTALAAEIHERSVEAISARVTAAATALSALLDDDIER
jgi:DNA-binding IclR family transcriptional regulator